MKKYFYVTALIFMIFNGPVSASEWTIEDYYIGGGYSNGYVQKSGDVISLKDEINLFNIRNMIVNIDDYTGAVQIKIRTDYIDGSRTTNYGDLFISTNGWKPFGTSPYKTDIYGNGEAWEFAFNTNAKKIYKTADTSILTSNSFFDSVNGSVAHDPDNWYRRDQEVQINPGSAVPVSTGETSFSQTIGYLTYAFSLSDLGISVAEGYDLGFRWTMTCANDIIEGGVSKVPVPEPATMILMGMGLLGISATLRKKQPGSSE